jgi:1-acyl-sn-glycerol-3-phosphate acyltransferase
MRHIVAFFRLTGILFITGFAIGMFVLAIVFRLSTHKIPLYWHKAILAVSGLRVHVIGTRSSVTPTLFASNHSSYWDIVVLGSLIEGSFIAKKEIASWPVVSFLAKLQKTYFVDRKPRHAQEQLDDLALFLQEKRNLILFPEGTSNDGNRVYPFKPTLFRMAEQDDLVIQPVTVVYSLLDGMPMHRGLRPLTAWYGDMDLFSHLWTVLGMGTLQVDVVFHDVMDPSAFASRKDMAKKAHTVIEQGLNHRYHTAFMDHEPKTQRRRHA